MINQSINQSIMALNRRSIPIRRDRSYSIIDQTQRIVNTCSLADVEGVAQITSAIGVSYTLVRLAIRRQLTFWYLAVSHAFWPVIDKRSPSITGEEKDRCCLRVEVFVALQAFACYIRKQALHE